MKDQIKFNLRCYDCNTNVFVKYFSTFVWFGVQNQSFCPDQKV